LPSGSARRLSFSMPRRIPFNRAVESEPNLSCNLLLILL
jgi:hypothetical protein